MSRQSYYDSAFTSPSRVVAAGPEQWAIPFGELVDLVERAKLSLPAPSCVFQVAHCGSTLLSQALDSPGSSIVVREPYILRQFASSPPPLKKRDVNSWFRGFRAVWHFLSRYYSQQEHVLIKGNVPVNFAIDELLSISPKSQGLLLYSDFEHFMVSILKAEERREWSRHVVKSLEARIKLQDAFLQMDFSQLSAAQSAAVLWISQIRQYEKALSSYKRLRALDSETFFTRPAICLSATAAHFGQSRDAGWEDQVVGSELFKRHAKIPDRSYSEDQRQQDHALLLSRYSPEIDICRQWLVQQSISLDHTLEQNALEI